MLLMTTKSLRGDRLDGLPIKTWRQVLSYYSQPRKRREDPGRVLVESDDFIHLVRLLANVQLDRRALLGYSSPKVGLIELPVQIGRRTCYVFPHDFDRLAIVLILRQEYHLSLGAIRDLLAHYPREHYRLLIERKLSVEDLLELAQMLKKGYRVGHAIMAKAFDAMLTDLLPSDEALVAAKEPGEALGKLQEGLLLARLDEMKAWVHGGGWREYVQRQAEQDLHDLQTRKKALAKTGFKGTGKPARATRTSA
jgi:DNA-binding transcriptional MerR regulator